MGLMVLLVPLHFAPQHFASKVFEKHDIKERRLKKVEVITIFRQLTNEVEGECIMHHKLKTD